MKMQLEMSTSILDEGDGFGVCVEWVIGEGCLPETASAAVLPSGLGRLAENQIQ